MARWTTANWKPMKMARKISSRQPARMPLGPRKILRRRPGGIGVGVKSGMVEVGLLKSCTGHLCPGRSSCWDIWKYESYVMKDARD
jgi:hypothetical protein